jgi:PadR family transcriptional regulator PadR
MNRTVATIERALMRGAGPTAVLQLLSRREMYGYELADVLAQHSGGVLAMGHSTLYPLLYNLEAKKLVTSQEREADSGRYRRYYAITPAGRRVLAAQRTQWRALEGALLRLGVLVPSMKASAG